MKRLGPQERLGSTRLGDWYPYWWLSDGAVNLADWADEAACALPADRRLLDVVSVLSVLSFEFVCLDRTMLCGVQRLPWLSEIDGSGSVFFERAPAHGHAMAPPGAIAGRLLDALRGELVGFCQAAPKVYVLLSGGMDSRVVAATLRSLEREGRIQAPIEAVTWGIEGSRDVRYARDLADRLGWPWHHLVIDQETYWQCFETAATTLGAEVDPKHLHRMPWFEAAASDSVVLAASYGDGIGRAEYSSKHVASITPLEPNDRYRLLTPRARRWAEPRLRGDIAAIRTRHGERPEHGWLEVERQAHYMRRMLCHPMSVINKWCRLRQAFTTPEVFTLMWSYDLTCRTNAVYSEMLRLLDPELAGLPWARTGAEYPQPHALADGSQKGFHRYGYWLRTHHAAKLESALFSGVLEGLGVFDMNQVRFMCREWRRERPADDTSLATQLSFLAVLSRFCERFSVLAPELPSQPVARAFEDEATRWVARGSQIARRITRPPRLVLSKAADAGRAVLRRVGQ